MTTFFLCLQTLSQKLNEQSTQSTTLNGKDYTEIQSDLDKEKVARRTAERKLGTLEHRISILDLDLTQRNDEASGLRKQLEEAEANLQKEHERRVQADNEAKKQKKLYEEKVAAKEHELKNQIADLKGDKQKMEDTVYRLKRSVI